MKELVLISGRGGAGRTSIAAAFAHIVSEGGNRIAALTVDADVDNPNLALLTRPEVVAREDFKVGRLAFIDPGKCTGCLICGSICRYDAIVPDQYCAPTVMVWQATCEGCAACVYQCAEGAIEMVEETAGRIYESRTVYGPLFHTFLKPSREYRSKLVTAVRQAAAARLAGNSFELVLVDGPSGTGSHVISTLTGSDCALAVAEPGASGVEDLERVMEITSHLGITIFVCINKFDIYPEGTARIEEFSSRHGIEVIGKIPFDDSVLKSWIGGMPVTRFGDVPAARSIRSCWELLLSRL